MDTTHIIGQAFGILSAICCFAGPLWKKKWQMLVSSAAANLFIAINVFILLGRVNSAIIMNIVAIIQIGFSMFHVLKEKPVTIAENVIFMSAYIVLGSLGIKSALDIIPIFGAALFMVSVFQRDEQKSRMIALGNAGIYFVYYLIISSASLFSEVVAIVTTCIALYKYRKK